MQCPQSSGSEDEEIVANVQCLETLLKQKIAGHMKIQPMQPEEDNDGANDGDDQGQAYISDGEDSDDVVMVSGNENHKHHLKQKQQLSNRRRSSAILDSAMNVDPTTVQLHQETATPLNDRPLSTVCVDEGSVTPTQSIIASEIVFDADDEATPKRRSSVSRRKVLKRRLSHGRRSRSLHIISTDVPMLHHNPTMTEERSHGTDPTPSVPLLQTAPPTTFLQKDVLKIIERETGMPYHASSVASIPSTISSTDRAGSNTFSFDQRQPQSSQSEHSSPTASYSAITSPTVAQSSTDSVSTRISTSVSSETTVPFTSQTISEDDKSLTRLSNSSTKSSVSDVVSDIASSHRSSPAPEDPVIEIHTPTTNVDHEGKRDPRSIEKTSDEQRETKQSVPAVKPGRGLTNMVSTAFSNITSNLRSFLPTSKPSERPAPATGAHKAKVKGTISSLRKAEMAKKLAQKREEERRNKRLDLRRRLEERRKNREEGESSKPRASTITTCNTTSSSSSNSSKQIVNSKKRRLMEKLEAHKRQNNNATPAQTQSTAEPPRKKTKPSLPSAAQVISKAQRLKSNLQLLKAAKTATSSSSSSSRQMLPGQKHKQTSKFSSSPVVRTTPNRNPTTPIGKGAMLPPSQPYVSPMLKAAFQSPASTKSSPSNVSVNSDNYPMTDDYYATSEEDELEEQRKGKRIPSWAKDKVVLNDYLRFTERMDPDLVFSPVKTIDLQDVFDNTHNKKRDLRKRTSSGNWARDHFTLAEEIQYKRDMGFKVTDIDLDDL